MKNSIKRWFGRFFGKDEPVKRKRKSFSIEPVHTNESSEFNIHDDSEVRTGKVVKFGGGNFGGGGAEGNWMDEDIAENKPKWFDFGVSEGSIFSDTSDSGTDD